MAIRLKVWLALVVGTCAAVAATLLPPDRMELPASGESPEQLRYEEALGELRRAHMTLQLTRWSDSLSALVVNEGSAGATPGELRLGAFWQPVAHGALPNVPRGIPTWSSITYADVVGAMPYCFTVHTYAGSGVDIDAFSRADLIDPCRMLDRFGAPGTSVGAWLSNGAWEFASAQEPVLDYMTLRDHSYAELPYFGERSHPLATRNVFVGGCMAGEPAACSRAVAEPVVVGDTGSGLRSAAESSGATYVDLDWPDESPFDYLDDSLFAELEQQFGQEAFASFWTSEQPVEAAFATAFGVELGDWVLAWVDEQMGTSRAGPSIPMADFLLAVLTIGALTGIASRVAMKRRVA